MPGQHMRHTTRRCSFAESGRMLVQQLHGCMHLQAAGAHSCAALQMRHPLALGQYINHPPGGSAPNLVVAATDVQLQPGAPRRATAASHCTCPDAGQQGLQVQRSCRATVKLAGAWAGAPGTAPAARLARTWTVHLTPVPPGEEPHLRAYLPNLCFHPLLDPVGRSDLPKVAAGSPAAALGPELPVSADDSVPGIALVATRQLANEELLLNYRQAAV